jgi:hypothetical protein
MIAPNHRALEAWRERLNTDFTDATDLRDIDIRMPGALEGQSLSQGLFIGGIGVDRC